MRTRIKVIEKYNGEKKYQPQAKDKLTALEVILFLPVLLITGKFTWRYRGLATYEKSDIFLLKPFLSELAGAPDCEICQVAYGDEGVSFNTPEEAKQYLDKYIQQEIMKHEKIEKQVNEVMSKMTKKEYYIEKTKVNEI